jgi:hypothetical protein
MTSSRPDSSVRLMSVLWPAFLLSIVLEGLLFTLFDPTAMRWSDSLGEALSPLAVYSVGFFVIWACISAAVALALVFDGKQAGAAD